MSQPEPQLQLHLAPQAKASTVALLYQIFGEVLIPIEQIRTRYFRNLNSENFKSVIGTERLPIPVTTLDDSRKAMRYVEIHHLAAHIEQCSQQAVEDLGKRLNKQDE
ncbi:pyocin activator PrtN family protein [Pseudomonas sp. W03]|uniref:pyocin activator PrtN family protein n=1 Tax=Pseudomonas sp. W03 TaxID=3090666 RepID=UPI003A4D79B7